MYFMYYSFTKVLYIGIVIVVSNVIFYIPYVGIQVSE